MKKIYSAVKLFELNKKIEKETEDFINGFAREKNIIDVKEVALENGNKLLVTVLFEETAEKIVTLQEEGYLLRQVIDVIYRHNAVSINLVQTELGMGFNKASEMVGILEEKGIISKKKGTKPREILVEYADALALIEEK